MGKTWFSLLEIPLIVDLGTVMPLGEPQTWSMITTRTHALKSDLMGVIKSNPPRHFTLVLYSAGSVQYLGYTEKPLVLILADVDQSCIGPTGSASKPFFFC